MTKQSIHTVLSEYEQYTQTLNESIRIISNEMSAWERVINELAATPASSKNITRTLGLYSEAQWLDAMPLVQDAGLRELYANMETTLKKESTRHGVLGAEQKNIELQTKKLDASKNEVFAHVRHAREQSMAANLGLNSWLDKETREDVWIQQHLQEWKNAPSSTESPLVKDYDGPLGFFEKPWALRIFHAKKYLHFLQAKEYRDTFGHTLLEGLLRFNHREEQIKECRSQIQSSSRQLDDLNAADQRMSTLQRKYETQLRDIKNQLSTALEQHPEFIQKARQSTLAAMIGYCLIHRIDAFGPLTIEFSNDVASTMHYGKLQAAQQMHTQLAEVTTQWEDVARSAAASIAQLTALKRKHGGLAKVNPLPNAFKSIVQKAKTFASTVKKEQPVARTHFINASQPLAPSSFASYKSSTDSTTNDSNHYNSIFWQMMWMHTLFSQTSWASDPTPTGDVLTMPGIPRDAVELPSPTWNADTPLSSNDPSPSYETYRSYEPSPAYESPPAYESSYSSSSSYDSSSYDSSSSSNSWD